MIKIAGVQVQLKNEYSIEENATEERAGGSLVVFSTREERFEMYDLVEITENTDTYQYLVQSDTIVKYDEERYEHTVNLIEPAAKFDAYYPADRTHSRIPPRSIGAILNVYSQELEFYHNLKITWDFQADWAGIPIRNKEYEGVNFSVILQDLFREIDARPKVKYNGQRWEITPYFFNNRNNAIPTTAAPNSQLKRQNNLDYATKVKAKLKNAVYSMDTGEYFPSPNGYILPKSSSPQKIDSNLQYQLDSGIVAIQEVVVIDVTIKSTSNGITVTTYNGDVDITNHVVTKEEWDILPNLNNDGEKGIHKKNTLYYTIGGNTIENLYVQQGGREIWVLNFDNIVIERAIVNAAQDQQLGLFTGQEEGTENNFLEEDIDQVKLRVKYTKQRDLDIMHHRQYLKNMNESTTIHNQSSSFVDVQSKKNNLKAISNRLGNEVIEESKVWDFDETPYQLGDYKGNYVIIKTKNTYKNGNILQEYVLAENFGNIDGQTSLWREPSPFTRTRKNLTTNLQIEEFVEISRFDKTVATRLLTNAQNNVMATLDKTITPTDPIAIGVFRPIMQTSNIVAQNGVVMPIFTGGGGNVTTIHIEFKDTYSAGVSFSDNYENGNFAENLIYAYPADEANGVKGELLSFRLFFTQSQEYLDNGRYPLVEALNDYIQDAMTDPNVVDIINKDINSRIAVTFNQHFVTDNENIVIGNAWAKYNRLISDKALGTKKVYKRNTPYTIYDKETDSQDTEISATWSVDTTNRRLIINSSENADYYAIAYDNEILLAFNDGIETGVQQVFYINFTEQADRIIVPFLNPPTIRNGTVTTDSVTYSLFNVNEEPVIIRVSYDGVSQDEQVSATGNTVQEINNATAIFTYTNIEPNFTVTIEAQARPFAGSENEASQFVPFTLTTNKLTLDEPLIIPERTEEYDQLGEPRYIAYFNVINRNDIPLKFIANVSGFEHVPEETPIPADTTVEIPIIAAGAGSPDTIEADTTYTIRGKWETTTFTNDWQTPYTDTDSFIISQQQAPTYISTNLGVTTLTTNWESPNDIFTEIQVQRARSDDPTQVLETKTAIVNPLGSVSIQFNNLQPETSWRFTARFLAREFNTESETTIATAGTLAQIQSAEPSIEARNIRTTAIDVRLTNNASYPVFIQFGLSTSYGQQLLLEANDFIDLPDEFTNLTQNTNYTLNARALRADDAGYTYSDNVTDDFKTVQEQTAKPTVTKNYNLTTQNTLWLDITNNDQQQANITYVINNSSNTITISGLNTQSVSVANLNNNTKYEVVANAFISGEKISLTETVDVITNMLEPSISNVDYMTTGDSVIELTFALTNTNGGTETIDATVSIESDTVNQTVAGGIISDIPSFQTQSLTFNIANGDLDIGDGFYVIVTFDNGDTTRSRTIERTTTERKHFIVQAKSNVGNPAVQIITPNEAFQDQLTQNYQVIDNGVTSSPYSITLDTQDLTIAVSGTTYGFDGWNVNGTLYTNANQTINNLTTDANIELTYSELDGSGGGGGGDVPPITQLD